MLRSPIVSVLGHVDHGKSSLLDAIRGSCIVREEAGAITQAIGASIVPASVLKQRCEALLKQLKAELVIPGLLFIDTPGHAAFTSLRKRGGSIADLAILVVDVNEGFKPQTIEALEILKAFKTPFIIAANKIDLVPGFVVKDKHSVLNNIELQQEHVKQELYARIYNLSSQLYKTVNLDAELFHKASFEKQVAIIPVSAKLGLGISELLAVLAGLAQRFLKHNLELHPDKPAKGVVMELKEAKGLGTVIDVILYDGVLRVNDNIVLLGKDGTFATRVRALLQPAPLQDIRSKKAKFMRVKQVTAATGVRIAAQDLENVVPGTPFFGVSKLDAETIEGLKTELKNALQDIVFSKESKGVIVKADALGSLEAVTKMFQEHGIPVKTADVGDISKKDVVEADSVAEQEPLFGAIIGFNVKNASPIQPKKAVVITSNIIYELLQKYEEWRHQKQVEIQQEQLKQLPTICKLRILPGYVFRQSNPAIVGVEILAGKLKQGVRLFKKDKPLTTVKSIEVEGQTISEALENQKVAISMPSITIGRQVREGDILYSYITEEEFKRFKALKHLLSESEILVLKEIAELMRVKNPVWGL